jgi:hypothetical protein
MEIYGPDTDPRALLLGSVGREELRFKGRQKIVQSVGRFGEL